MSLLLCHVCDAILHSFPCFVRSACHNFHHLRSKPLVHNSEHSCGQHLHTISLLSKSTGANDADLAALETATTDSSETDAFEFANDLDAKMYEILVTDTMPKHTAILLAHPIFYQHFFHFCRLRLAFESVMFWGAVEKFHRQHDDFTNADAEANAVTAPTPVLEITPSAGDQKSSNNALAVKRDHTPALRTFTRRRSNTPQERAFLLHTMKESARQIYIDFVDENGEYCVNLPHFLVDDITSLLYARPQTRTPQAKSNLGFGMPVGRRRAHTLVQSPPPRDLFDKAQREIVKLLTFGPVVEFRHSPLYLEFLRDAEQFLGVEYKVFGNGAV